jgi:type II secretory pathway pseudopilin PulG
MRALARVRREESGMSLIELIVYMALMGVVLTIATGFLINSMSTQKNVQSSTDATSAAQLVANSVAAAVSNASAVQQGPALNASDQFVVARTATRGDTATWMCRAWYYSAADHAIYTTTSNPAAPITVPTGGPAGVWTLLAANVDAPAGASALHATSGSVSLNFSLAAASGAPVNIQTTDYLRVPATAIVSSPCF